VQSPSITYDDIRIEQDYARGKAIACLHTAIIGQMFVGHCVPSRMRSQWLLILLTACGSVNSSAPDDGAVPDGGNGTSDGGTVDTNVPPVDASPCIGGGFVQLCLTDLPIGPLTVSTSVQIDADRDSRCTSFTPANTGWCVISATRITVAAGATLSAISTIRRRALVLVATESIQIDGTIDVASHVVNRTRVPGAGAQASECVSPTSAMWPGGGAGGSFRSRGGNGGTALNMGGAGIAAAPTTTLNKLRGGCTGGGGGVSDNPGGAGGEGGGAVYLLAPSITVAGTGVINASGSGGLIAPVGDTGLGGGGGGSGGMIGLEAAAIRLAVGARLLANGGGGAEGNGCGSTPPANGQDPISPTVPAVGGRIDPSGGDGGDGAISTSSGAGAGNGVANCQVFAGGGGGGGGGGGAIVFRGSVTDAGAQISPPSVALP
jgi:hypothetical protein